MKLRPYQQKMIDDTREALTRHQSVLLQGPTGSGKTAITVFMMQRAAERGISSMFLVHQGELLRQTSKALWEQKLSHGMIAAGKRQSKMPAQVASVQTLVRRTANYPEPGLIIIDEAHRAAASTYSRILDAYPNAKVIGLTATPARTDGRGLTMFTDLVLGPKPRQLIDAGYLCDYEIFAPPSMADVGSIKTTMGDYNKKELESAMDKPTITGDAVAHYKTHAMGKRCVVMAVSIKHAEHVKAQYNAEGVPCEMIEGRMTDREREAILARFAAGETLVLVNVQLLIEGVDIPAIEVVQWLRPTQSLIVWMQGVGRGLRPAEGKERLIIFDHVGNVWRHGLPDEDREWSLEGRKARKKKEDEDADVTVQQCGNCFHIFRPGPSACPACGAEIKAKKKTELQVVDGALEKLDVEAERKARRQEQGAARTLRELVELGVRRGMNKPASWSAITMAARAGRKPTPAEFSQAKKIYSELCGFA